MKHREITNCPGCGRGVCASNPLMFFRAKVERMVVDHPAVQRQAGLEMMLGGHSTLANVLGPDEDIAKSLSTTGMLICMDCAVTKPVLELLEQAEETEPDDEGV